jgi:hypothetical protein
VEISNRPADARGGGRRDVEGDFYHRLGLLRDYIARGGRLKNRIAVLERRNELEAKLSAILRRPAPKTFCDNNAFDTEHYLRKRGVGLRDG